MGSFRYHAEVKNKTTVQVTCLDCSTVLYFNTKKFEPEYMSGTKETQAIKKARLQHPVC